MVVRIVRQPNINKAVENIREADGPIAADIEIVKASRAKSDRDRDVRIAALQELARGWPSDPDTLRILKSRAKSDENGDVRRAAAREIERLGQRGS